MNGNQSLWLSQGEDWIFTPLPTNSLLFPLLLIPITLKISNCYYIYRHNNIFVFFCKNQFSSTLIITLTYYNAHWIRIFEINNHPSFLSHECVYKGNVLACFNLNYNRDTFAFLNNLQHPFHHLFRNGVYLHLNFNFNELQCFIV
jgi:hypothetical protein